MEIEIPDDDDESEDMIEEVLQSDDDGDAEGERAKLENMVCSSWHK